MTLSRETILKSQDIKIERVEVPEWGGEVCIRTINGFERGQLETLVMGVQAKDKEAAKTFHIRIASLCLSDENGKRLFSDDDLEVLGQKSGEVLARLVDVALRVNGLTKAEVESIGKN